MADERNPPEPTDPGGPPKSPDPGAPPDRSWAVPVIGVLAVVVVLGGAGVGFVALTATTGCACQPPTPEPPRADVDVTTTDGALEVHFRDGENVGHVAVAWSAPNGSLDAGGGEAVTVANGSARLAEAGATLVLAETAPGTDTRVTVSVRAVGPTQEVVVAERTERL